MPTPAERKALVFLAAVALLGGGVRLARAARGSPEPEAGARRALAAQLARVDSARRAQGEGRARRPRSRPAGDSTRRARRSGRGARDSARVGQAPTSERPLDLDAASPAEIEGLPGVGAVLARRIVARRDSCGAFGSLAALERVKGVGPRLVERLRPLVTFSGTRRPPRVGPGGCDEAEGGGRPRAVRSLRHSAKPGTVRTLDGRSTRGAVRGETAGSRRGVSP